MAMISLDEAAARLGAPPQTIEEWAKKSLLHVHTVVTAGGPRPDSVGVVLREQQVDEEELAHVAENLGWLQLSAEEWDDDERG